MASAGIHPSATFVGYHNRQAWKGCGGSHPVCASRRQYLFEVLPLAAAASKQGKNSEPGMQEEKAAKAIRQ